MGAIGGALLAPAVQAVRARALAAAGVPPGQTASAPAPGTPQPRAQGRHEWAVPAGRGEEAGPVAEVDPDDRHPALSASL
ncbi:MAG: hypothetical protein JO114_22910 [Planctomycetaceae bacterium]|nr:hypothetical protein [Planctomycetaceae bacterium]MBV8309919.1 hypothetical protein [Planctomycetaceae bacterium]